MRYTPATGYALMMVAVLCFLVGAPPWMFLATGAAAVTLGVVGLRQVSSAGSDDEPADESADGPADR